MKIFVLSELREGPWGGGNQFLKGLAQSFGQSRLLGPSLGESDVVIVNSHHWQGKILSLLRWRVSHPAGRILHRVDGPISVVRGGSAHKLLDRRITLFSRLVADGTVFQTNWSREHCRSLGLIQKNFRVISNAPDPKIFYPASLPDRARIKTRVISASWSSNPSKGFSLLSQLDGGFDTSRLDLVFIGNSPGSFQRIRQKPPLPSKELAEELRNADVFLAPSENDPCSNALIEAIHCGLVPVALNSGGHPEIVKNPALLFSNLAELEGLLALSFAELRHIWGSPKFESMAEISDSYADFSSQLLSTPRKKMTLVKLFLFTLVDGPLDIVSRFSNRLTGKK